MADRDFNIPMGPDRTGQISVPEVIPTEGAPADQTIAQAPISTADLRGFEPQGAAAQPVSAESDPVAAWLSSSAEAASSASATPIDIPASVPAASVPGTGPLPVTAPAPGEALDEGPSYVSDTLFEDRGESSEVDPEMPEEGETTSGPASDVAASIGALRDSIGQGRELKAREKDREDLADKISIDREELADRDDILANYQAIVAEQDGIVADNTQRRDMLKAELSHTVAETEETTEALNRMRDFNDVQLQPYETALGRAQATADQAKNDERSRKSELSAAESELRRAENGDAANTARARHDVAKEAYEQAVARSNAAKEALADAQRAYDSLRDQVDQAEAPLERTLEDLEKKTEELKEEIARLGDIISAASKRRQYCDAVYQYPDETEKLRQTVEADEAMLAKMDEETEDLRERLAESKAKSTKAKALIVGVVVFVILLILLFWYLSTR